MKKHISILIVALLLLSVVPLATGEEDKVKVIVTFDGEVDDNLAAKHKGKMKHKFSRVLKDTAVLEVPRSELRKLRKNKRIKRIEDDAKVYGASQTLPWGVDRIDGELAPNDGNGEKVCILDSGVDKGHEDLRKRIGPKKNFLDVGGSKDVTDLNGHGTMLAGIIAANDNAKGVVGVAPKSKLVIGRVLDANLVGDVSDLIAGIEWCMNKNSKVISLSLVTSNVQALHDAIDTAYAEGAVIVGAAGNDNGGPVAFPAAYDSVIAVSATDDQDNLASFSNYGPEIELAAPGQSIFSTWPDDLYNIRSGTSFAVAHVSGAAAVATEANPGMTNVQIRELLQNTADDLGDPGFDNQFGYGIVDAELI